MMGEMCIYSKDWGRINKLTLVIINCYKQYSGDEFMFVGVKNLHSRAIVIWETGKIASIALSCCNDAVHWVSSLISF